MMTNKKEWRTSGGHDTSKNGKKEFQRAQDCLLAGHDQRGQASLICFPGTGRTL